jgi:hypothetical protein
MHNSTPAKSSGLPTKTCAQLVGNALQSPKEVPALSTNQTTTPKATWKNRVVSPARLHKFVMRFYPPQNNKLTDRARGLSPLSTPLIIRTKWVKEENLLIGQGG